MEIPVKKITKLTRQFLYIQFNDEFAVQFYDGEHSGKEHRFLMLGFSRVGWLSNAHPPKFPNIIGGCTAFIPLPIINGIEIGRVGSA